MSGLNLYFRCLGHGEPHEKKQELTAAAKAEARGVKRQRNTDGGKACGCGACIKVYWANADSQVCVVRSVNTMHSGHACPANTVPGLGAVPYLTRDQRQELVEHFVTMPSNPQAAEAMATVRARVGHYVLDTAVTYILALAKTMRKDGDDERRRAHLEELCTEFRLGDDDIVFNPGDTDSHKIVVTLKQNLLDDPTFKFIVKLGAMPVAEMTRQEIPAITGAILGNQSSLFLGSATRRVVTDEHYRVNTSDAAYAATQPTFPENDRFFTVSTINHRCTFSKVGHKYKKVGGDGTLLPSSTLLSSMVTPTTPGGPKKNAAYLMELGTLVHDGCSQILLKQNKRLHLTRKWLRAYKGPERSFNNLSIKLLGVCGELAKTVLGCDVPLLGIVGGVKYGVAPDVFVGELPYVFLLPTGPRSLEEPPLRSQDGHQALPPPSSTELCGRHPTQASR